MVLWPAGRAGAPGPADRRDIDRYGRLVARWEPDGCDLGIGELTWQRADGLGSIPEARKRALVTPAHNEGTGVDP